MTTHALGNTSLSALDRKLLLWLDSDTDRFERYITKHPEAADRVEELLALGDDVRDALRAALATAVAAPIDLVERIAANLNVNSDTAPSSVIMDLFGVGLETVQLWLNE
jgi:anti-sigma factor RsiW